MTINDAKYIIRKSVENLIRINGQITIEQLEAEVINSACLYILKTHSQDISQVSQSNLIMNHMPQNLLKFQSTAECFTNAALEIFPNNYNSDLADYANITIIQNITWSGMFDFLKTYYRDNHGLDIDNKTTFKVIFNSKIHTRFEDGLATSAYVERKIVVSFLNEQKRIIIEIIPTISPKTAYLINEKNNEKKYKGDDPDFEFILDLNSKSEIERMTMYRLDKKVFWIYK